MTTWLAWIGTITGIIGTVLGYVSYKRTEEFKALDLRIEIKKTANSLRLITEGLTSLLEKARQSRERVASATGQLDSGALQKWKSDWDADHTMSMEYLAALPDSNEDYSSFTQAELERHLVSIHALEGKAIHLQEKYTAFLANDDKDREQIKADVRARNQRMFGLDKKS